MPFRKGAQLLPSLLQHAAADERKNKVEGKKMTQEEKNGRYLLVTMIATLVIALTVVTSAAVLVPRTIATMDQAQETMTQASEVMGDLGSMKESLEQLVGSTEGGNLGNLDVEGLNESIQDLQKIVKPLASLFGN